MANQTPPDDTPQDAPEPVRVSFRLRRFRSRWPLRVWRAVMARRWSRWLAIAVLVMALLYGVLWVTVIRSLPSADKLLTYQPPLPTMVRGNDGEIVSSYARERRVQLRFVALLIDPGHQFDHQTGRVEWTCSFKHDANLLAGFVERGNTV